MSAANGLPRALSGKILVTRRLPPNVTARLQRDFNPTLNPEDVLRTPAEWLQLANGHDAILCCATEWMDAQFMANLPGSVRMIATFSVGYEHIDVAGATARNIIVTHTPEVLTDATADMTMLCLLAAARRAREGDALVRTGEWSVWTTEMLLGVHVTGKRLGIYGMGRIGRAVARRARGFGMEIHYHNRTRLAPELELGAIYHESAERLLAVSQFLSLNAPAAAQNDKFLNEAAIGRLPDGAVVVNTARGSLVDDDALIAALTRGKLAAAGLDVFAGEPRLDERYRTLANVFTMPHLGSATHETRDAMGFCCLDNLSAFFAGKPCPNALNDQASHDQDSR
ncbi:MAG: D-glycerate dehydrogenase [Gammaproteobacteria bacterium]|nr:D-glycerate dehydrogenase [Gammaproteobacteria bacterium]